MGMPITCRVEILQFLTNYSLYLESGMRYVVYMEAFWKVNRKLHALYCMITLTVTLSAPNHPK